MTNLTLTLRTELRFPLDVSCIVPNLLQGMDKQEIGNLQLNYGNESIKVSELFKISGTNTDKIRFKNSGARLTHIGAEMTTGEILVEGDAGDFLGSAMAGGKIQVQGDTACWTGASMSGGKIEVFGSSSDYLGAAQQGKVFGMSGGTIIVHENNGDRTGERMRRGTIVVFGQSGEFTACKMLAGTIIVLGKTGAYIGMGMRRGTIVLARKPRRLVPTFRNCGYLKIEFLRLLFKQLATSCEVFEVFSGFGPEAVRYAGDESVGGLGEILVLKNARLVK